MKSPSIIQSITGTPSVSIWSDALNTSVSVVRSKSEDNFLLTAPARTLVIRSNNIVASWRLSNRGHRLQWFQVGSSMLLRPAPALDGSPQQAHGPAADLVANATSVAAEPPPKRPPTEKIELDIDSLPNYEVLKPIPVLIEPLGDKVFVAEAPDLNLSTSGNSVGAAFLMLKEHIAATYEGYHNKKAIDPQRARQLTLMDKYIGKAKRNWF